MSKSSDILRPLAAEGLTIRQAMQRTGMTYAAISASARRNGFAFALEPPKLSVSRRKFEALWTDPAMSREAIAEAIGVGRVKTVSWIAKEYGLPPRRSGPAVVYDEQLFRDLWNAGVRRIDIQRVTGVSRNQATIEARRLGLPERGKGWANGAITLDQYRAQQLAERMTAAARETQAALQLSEMVDGRQGRRDQMGRAA